MKTKIVKEMMTPISECATLHEDANMAEAIRTFESENKRYADAPYRNQSLMVIDSNRHAVERLSQVDMMHSLEPDYFEFGEPHWINRTVLNKKVLPILREEFQLWEKPPEVMC